MALTDLLVVDEQYAIDLLRQVATRKTGGLVAFTAEMTLMEWKKGKLAKASP